MRLHQVWVSAVVIAGASLLAPVTAARAEVPAKAAAVEPPPRTPLPPDAPSPSLPWEPHLAIGPDFLFASRLVSTDSAGKPTPIRLRPAPAYGAHVSWDVLRYLRFTAYFVGARHTIDVPPGALVPSTAIASDTVNTYVFGARASPTLPIYVAQGSSTAPRGRAWLTAGVGWGRFAYPRMTARDPGQAPFLIPERSSFLVELPLGIGASFDIVPGWLSLQLELTGAFILGQEGSAIDTSQAIDATGKMRTVGGLPRIDGSLVQAIGLSLLL